MSTASVLDCMVNHAIRLHTQTKTRTDFEQTQHTSVKYDNCPQRSGIKKLGPVADKEERLL
jgi:hypothetical protein